MTLSQAHTTEQAARDGWWRTPFRTFQTNLREIDADLDVEAVLDGIQRQGCDTWLLNTGGILSWYPSELPFQTPNPRLAVRESGDLVGDAVEAAARRGIRVMSRMDFSKVTAELAERHPEWCYRSPTGELQVFEGLVSVCPNGEYYQARMFDVVDEVVARYPISGFFFNWFGFNEVDYSGRYHGVCHCAGCVDAFSERLGGALPTGPDDAAYAEWTALSAGVVDELTARMRAHLAERAPQVALILGTKADIVFHEANNALGRELWPFATEEAVSAARSMRPDAPVLVNAVAFVDMPYRMAGEQPEQLEHYLLQAISRGAYPSTYIMGPIGAIDYDNLDAAARITRFHRDHAASVYAGLDSAAPIALVRPHSLGRAKAGGGPRLAEFRGLYEALVEAHVPFDVVPFEALSRLSAGDELARYSAIVLPDLGGLGTAAADLDAYVLQGGVILATGTSGVGADATVQLATAPAEEALRVQRLPAEILSSYVEGPSGMLPVVGTHLDFRWRADAEGRSRYLPPAPYGPPEKAYGHAASGDPGWAIRRLGPGAVVQFPWTIGRTFHELGTTESRDVFVAALLEFAGPTAIDASGLPDRVEVVVGRRGGDVVVHLINFTGVRRRNYGAPLPVRDVVLRLPASLRRGPVRALVDGRKLPVEGDGSVRIPELGLFEVLVVQGEAL